MVHGAQFLKTRTTSSICIYVNVLTYMLMTYCRYAYMLIFQQNISFIYDVMNSRVNLVKRAFEFLLFQIFPAKVFEVKTIRILMIISRIL